MTFSETIEIALITAGVTFTANFVFATIKIKFNLFEEKTIFKKKHFYNQLCNLYLNLYAIIAQSEYIRCFHNFQGDFSDFPFFEINSRKMEQKINLKVGEPIKINKSEMTVKNAITEFNKEKIVQLILDNAQYASQKLLKLAVAHRYVAEHYTDLTIEPDILEKFQVEEIVLIKYIVETIVKETNKQLKCCNMDYNDEESATGILINGTVD